MIVRLRDLETFFIEDYLPYQGESEWVEVDSDEITYFIADHQDQFDTLEINDEGFIERTLRNSNRGMSCFGLEWVIQQNVERL